MWTLQLPFLEPLGELYAPDFPGFGREPPLAQADRLPETYADWLAERIRDRWGGGAVSVAGYSMGGTVALLFALRHPALVSRLVVACSPPRWTYGWRRILPVFLHRFTARSAAEVFQLTVRFGARWFLSDPGLRLAVLEMVRLAHRPTMVSLCRKLAATDLRKELRNIRVPSLVVAGSRDLWQPAAVAQAVAGSFERGRLQVLQGAGHMLCLSRPTEFGEVLADFLSSSEGQDRKERKGRKLGDL